MVVWLYCDLQFDDLQVMFDPSFVWYAWYVARSTVCMPSDLLAVWFQSRYETKLWHVRQLYATGSPRLTASLADLRGRYYDSLKQPFESKLDYMLAKNHDDKFGESLGWELFNQQPVRYLFNTNKCLSGATCAMFASVQVGQDQVDGLLVGRGQPIEQCCTRFNVQACVGQRL